MSTISRNALNEIVALLSPLLDTRDARTALIDRALGFDKRGEMLRARIDFDGPTSNFVVALVRQLTIYGEIEPGTPALVAVLETAREQVGADKQAQFDALVVALSQPSAAVEDVVAAATYAPPSGEHVFVSYSRADKGFVLHVIADMERRGVRVWVDQSGLTPGTPDWEQALRDAIRGSRALVLAASPDSRRSAYVKDEIRIAQMYKRPIYPVWVAGDEWMDSIPMGLGGVQFVDLRGNAYADGIAQIAASLADVTPLEAQPDVKRDPVARNPYKGLQAFTAEDVRYFFGRDKLIEELTVAIGAEDRFLPVVGASGSGKSSVVMAGLLPRLRDTHPDWTFLRRVVPGAHPLEMLAKVLAAAIPGALTPAVLDSLKSDATNRSLHLLASQIGGERVVLFVDQFEELFTQAAPAERSRFIDLLTAAATEPGGPLMVILTMRADFMDRPLSESELARLFQAHAIFMKPMDVSDLRDVIVKPAALQGLTFDENLVGDLLFEVRGESGALPLLQFTLEQLYERREGERLTRAAYDDIGGVRGAIARQAEATYTVLPSERHQQLARTLFLRLIEPGATEQDTTRRRVNREELTLADGDDTSVLAEVARRFTDARLLVADEDTLEVAHEALIREWERLQGWMRDAREDLRLQKALTADAAEWVRRGRDPNDPRLYRDSQLLEVQEWAQRNVSSADEAAFVEVSFGAQIARTEREARIARRVQNFQRASMVLGVMVILALGAGLFALLTAREAQQRADTAGTREAAANSALTDVPPTLDAVATDVQVAQNFADSIQLAARAQDVFSQGGSVDAGQASLSLRLAYEASLIDAPIQTQRILGQLAYAPGVRRLYEGHMDSVNSVAFSPDGSLILAGDADSVVILRNTETGEIVQQFEGHAGGVNSVTFSPDGRMVLSGGAVGENEAGELLLWGVETGEIVQRFEGHEVTVSGVAFSPDGRTVISGGSQEGLMGETGELFLWDVETGEMTRRFEGFAGSVVSVAFSPDGQTVFSGGSAENFEDFGDVILWDVATGEIIRRIEGHSGGTVTSVTFSPDGQSVLAGSNDQTAIVWDVATGEIQRRFEGHDDSVTSVAFSPDGTAVVTGSEDDNVIVWDVATGAALHRFTVGWVHSVAFSPDGSRVLSGSDKGAVQLWDIDVGALLWRSQRDEAVVNKVAFSPDGQAVVSGGGFGFADVLLWDVSTGDVLRRFEGHMQGAGDVVFSPDGQTVLFGGSSFGEGAGELLIWDVATGELLQSFEGHTQPIESVAFSLDGEMVLSGAGEGTMPSPPGELFLWDVAAGELIRSFEGHEQAVNGVAFSPDGEAILSGGSDDAVIVWDMATGEIVRRFESDSGIVFSVAFSPDGTRVLSGASDGSVTLWDVETGAVVRRFEGHTDLIYDVAFSPDGALVLSGSQDNTLIVWDVATGDVLRRFEGHDDYVTSVAFSPDGMLAASGSGDDSLILWRIDSVEQLQAWVRENRYMPELTCEQRAVYGVVGCVEGVPPPTATFVPTRTPFPIP